MTTRTGGLIYAVTRHATSRAGDPNPHDHVLIANLVRMVDDKGGWKGAHTALMREHLHAATMFGRVAAAHEAVRLGYGIERDDGPSGKLGHWRIAGIPHEVLEVHSKRAAEIDAEMDRLGYTSWRAKGIVARNTRSQKEAELARWRVRHAAGAKYLDDLAAPERRRLDKAEANLAGRLSSLHEQRERRESWFADHPEAARRLHSIERDVETLTVEVDRPSPGVTAGRGASRELPWLRDPPVIDRGLDLGVGR